MNIKKGFNKKKRNEISNLNLRNFIWTIFGIIFLGFLASGTTFITDTNVNSPTGTFTNLTVDNVNINVNLTTSGLILNDTFIIDFGEINANSSIFWSSVSSFVSKWFYDDSNVLNFNETIFNISIDDRGIINNWSSKYNATYNIWAYNQSAWLISIYGDNWYNHTSSLLGLIDEEQIYNHTISANKSIFDTYDSRWSTTYNATYDAKADYQFLANNFNGSGNGTFSYVFGDGRFLTNITATSGFWNISGSNLFPFDLSYNVGIGTASPGTNRLSIVSPTESIAAIAITNGVVHQHSIRAIHSGAIAGNKLHFDVAIANGTPTNVMSLIGNGNVGIGTTAPSLDTGHGLHLADATATGIRLQDTDAVNKDFEIRLSSSANALNIYHTNTDSDVMTITSAGDVGIGTTTPLNLLHVKTPTDHFQGILIGGNTGVPTLSLRREHNDTTLSGGVGWGTIDFKDSNGAVMSRIYSLRNGATAGVKGSLAFYVGGDSTIAMHLKHDGQVGIGTTSPDDLLEVSKTINTGYTAANTLTSGQIIRITNPSTTGNAAATILFKTDGSDLATISGVDGGANSMDLTFGTKAGGNIIERMRILDNGNVGIGTAGPNNQLSISGPSSDATSSSGNILELISPGGNGFQAGANDIANIAFIQTKNADDLAINLHGGDVGIGTAAPVSPIDAYGNKAAGFAGRFQNDGNNQDRHGLEVWAGADDGSGTTTYFEADDGNGGATGYLKSVSGVFQLVDVSDERLKENIELSNMNALNIINNIPIKEFDFKEISDSPKLIGFMAQDLEAVYPSAVGEGDEKEVDGKNITVKTVARSELIPVLVKAIQELSDENDLLKSENDAIKQTLCNLNQTEWC